MKLLLTSTGVPSLHEGLWRQSLESDRRQILVTTLFEHAGGEAALHRLRISIHCEKHRTGPGRAIKINGEIGNNQKGLEEWTAKLKEKFADFIDRGVL